MEDKRNIFEIVREENLNFILPSGMRNNVQRLYPLNKVGVFIYLYYTENMDFYLNYIRNVPIGIDIYIYRLCRMIGSSMWKVIWKNGEFPIFRL